MFLWNIPDVSKLEVRKLVHSKLTCKHLQTSTALGSEIHRTAHDSSSTWLPLKNRARELIAVGHIPRNQAIHPYHQQHWRMKNNSFNWKNQIWTSLGENKFLLSKIENTPN